MEKQGSREKGYKVWVGLLIGIVLAVAGGFAVYQSRTVVPSGPLQKVTLAVNKLYAGSALVFVAMDRGYFREAGLDLSLQQHASGKSSLDAVIKGEADFATTADLPVVFAAIQGSPVMVVASLSTSSSDYGVVARRDAGIKGPADLKGKRIGITFGTSADFFIDGFLLRQHLSRKDVVLRGLKPPELAPALGKGELDAVTTWEPHLSEARNGLGRNAIFFANDGYYEGTWTIASTRPYLERSPASADRLVRALVRAERYYRNQPAESLAIIARHMGISVDEARQRLAYFKIEVLLEQRLITALEDEARWALKLQLADGNRKPNFLDHFYLKAMVDAKPDGVTVIH